MDNDGIPWGDVAEAAKAELRRQRKIGNLAAISRESGVSDATWRKFLNGQGVGRADKLQQIGDYLGWPVDTFDRLAAGEDMAAITGPAASIDFRSGIDLSDLTPEEQAQVRGYIDALRERKAHG